MQALIFDKSKEDWATSRGFTKADVPAPVLDPEDPADADNVLIKIHYAGVCGSDRGIWYRSAFGEQILSTIDKESKTYRVIGHELFGEIKSLGPAAAKKYALAAGDLVSCESHVVCNQCFQCVHGEKNVCTNEAIIGISRDGCFAEYIKVPGHIVWKTDTSKIRPEVAAVQEPFGNAVHAVSKADVKGKTVAIFGLGPIGLFAVLIARGRGAEKIIGIEPNPVAADMARRLGIDYVIPLKGGSNDFHHSPEVVDEVLKATGGLGVDIAFEMAGFNSSVNNAIYATRRGGEVILFGIKSGDFVLENYNALIVRGVTMKAIIGRQVWETWHITRELLENPANQIQEKIWNVILAGGKDTVIPIAEYDKKTFEEKMSLHPKLLLQF